jgi:hypothetical protein
MPAWRSNELLIFLALVALGVAQYIPTEACLKQCVPSNHTLYRICGVTDAILNKTFEVAAGQGLYLLVKRN